MKNIITGIGVIAFVWLGCLSLYWVFYPYNVVTFNRELLTGKVVYNQGEILDTNTEIVHHTEGVLVRVIKQLYKVNGENEYINFPETSYVTKKEIVRFTNRTIVIPTGITPGEYLMSVVSVFEVNPLRDITIIRFTNKFIIK